MNRSSVLACRLMIVFILLLAGCSLEGRNVGGCILHQSNSLTAGVAWADCPAHPDRVYVAGQSNGYAQAIGPYANGAFIGAGAATAGLLIGNSIPEIPGVP